jgi:hypothetical protein
MNGSDFTGSAGRAVPTLVGSRFSGRGARLSMGISSKRRGARGGSHLGQQSSWEAAVAAHDGGATLSGLVDNGGRLRCSSGLNKRSRSFATESSSSLKPSIAASGSRRWRAMAVARVLGLSILWVKIQVI